MTHEHHIPDDERFEALAAEALFGTLTPEQGRQLDAILAASPERAEELRQLEATLRLTAQRAAPTPPEAVFEGLADRLHAQIAPAAPTHAEEPWWTRLGESVRAFFAPAPAWSWQLAMAVVLIGIGVVIGQNVSEPTLIVDSDVPVVGPDLTASGEQPAGEEGVQPAVLAQRHALNYLDRSKVLLLGLVNAGEEDVAHLNLDRKQSMARELVTEARLLREDLDATDQQRLRALVDDLEVILLQIANLEAEADLPAIELVQSSVDQRGLLLKINLTQMRMADD